MAFPSGIHFFHKFCMSSFLFDSCVFHTLNIPGQISRCSIGDLMNFPRFSLSTSLKLNSFLTPRPHLFQLFFLFATCHSRILFFVHFLFISYGLFAYRAHFVGSAKFFLLLHSIFRATKKKRTSYVYVIPCPMGIISLIERNDKPKT